MKAQRTYGRPGFTLIELLVVIGIIIVLMAITIGAIFRVIGVQEKSLTQTVVNKVHFEVDRHWAEGVDQASEEFNGGKLQPGYNAAVIDALAGGNRDRSKVIYLHLRMKQEFPVTFSEATSPIVINVGNNLTMTIPPKRVYVDLFGAGPWGLTPQEESSACLYAILNQARRGYGSDLENILGPSAIKEKVLANGKRVKIITDIWDKPLMFFRWPSGNAELGVGNNPLDGSRVLMQPTWNNANNVTNVTTLERVLGFPLRATNGQPVSYKVIPTVASSGKNKAWGILPVTMAPDPNPNINGVEDASDNIYSFRLRSFGSRGD